MGVSPTNDWLINDQKPHLHESIMSSLMDVLPTRKLFENLLDSEHTWRSILNETDEPELTVEYAFRLVDYQYNCLNQDEDLVEELSILREKFMKETRDQIQQLSEEFKVDNPLSSGSPFYPLAQNRMFELEMRRHPKAIFECSCGYVGYESDLIEHFEIAKHPDEYLRYFTSVSCPRCYTRKELRERGYFDIEVQDMKKLLTLYACNDEYDNSQNINMYRMLNQIVI